jgi:hypothetical protein
MASDTVFYPVTIIAGAADAPEARRGACAFHQQDCAGFKDTADMMLPRALSETGELPATAFCCSRHDTLEHFERIEAYQQKRVAEGKPRVPVTVYVGEKPISSGANVEKECAAHEAEILATLNLRRVAK